MSGQDIFSTSTFEIPQKISHSYIKIYDDDKIMKCKLYVFLNWNQN